MHELIFVLGAQNSATGALDRNATARADVAFHLCRARPQSGLILTGGRAPHFNVSRRPHAGWMADYLIQLGLPIETIVGGVLSGNTVEDAVCAQDLVAACAASHLLLVTSQFHAQRAGLVFRSVFPQREVTVVAAENALPPDRLSLRRAHEERAIAELVRQQGIVWRHQRFPLPAVS